MSFCWRRFGSMIDYFAPVSSPCFVFVAFRHPPCSHLLNLFKKRLNHSFRWPKWNTGMCYAQHDADPDIRRSSTVWWSYVTSWTRHLVHQCERRFLVERCRSILNWLCQLFSTHPEWCHKGHSSRGWRDGAFRFASVGNASVWIFNRPAGFGLLQNTSGRHGWLCGEGEIHDRSIEW